MVSYTFSSIKRDVVEEKDCEETNDMKVRCGECVNCIKYLKRRSAYMWAANKELSGGSKEEWIARWNVRHEELDKEIPCVEWELERILKKGEKRNANKRY